MAGGPPGCFDGVLNWSSFRGGQLKAQGSFVISKSNCGVDGLGSGDARSTGRKARGNCRPAPWSAMANRRNLEISPMPSGATPAWMDDLMARSPCGAVSPTSPRSPTPQDSLSSTVLERSGSCAISAAERLHDLCGLALLFGLWASWSSATDYSAMAGACAL